MAPSTPAGPQTSSAASEPTTAAKAPNIPAPAFPSHWSTNETYPTKQEAMRREWEIKQLTREEKKKLIVKIQ